jgi:hypothetical protein
MGEPTDVTLKQATYELLQTSIFKNISRRTNNRFAEKLAIWLVRYILIISSMNESLHINLEQILLNLHGDRLKKIVNITTKSVETVSNDSEKYDSYIW